MLVTRAKGAKVGKAELKVNKTIRVPLDLNIEVQMVRQGCLWMKQIPSGKLISKEKMAMMEKQTSMNLQEFQTKEAKEA
jgi:hypothetical protein